MDEDGHTSVVLHADLDCFYAAVEHVRLGIPTEVPLAVQQWEGCIAVNYAARAAGIVRHERVSEALRKCPELQLVHVETIGGDPASVGTAESLGPGGKAKASLERYRQASAKVLNIFRRYSKLCERASIDEAYLDVSEQVEEMLQKDSIDWEAELHRLVEPAPGSEKGVMLIEGGSLAVYNAYDRRLLAGAIIADRMRASVRNELGYTISVGIASNKLLAKIASAKNKPDRQTLIPPRSVPGLMQDLPLKKIKLLGGKLGEEMKKKWGCTTAGEAQQIPQAALVATFGERLGTYAWKAVQGLKAEKVQVKDLVKSMLASKSFGATNDPAEIRNWLSVLAQELAIRMHRDFEMNQRQPKLFQLYYRSGIYRNSADHSRSTSMPPSILQILTSPAYVDTDGELNTEVEPEGEVEVQGDVRDGITERTKALAKVLEETSFRIIDSVDGLFPCTRLAIAATGFHELPSQGTKSIQHFFTSHANAQPDPPAINNIPTPAVSPSKKQQQPQGILKYLATNRSDDQEEPATNTTNLPPSEQHGDDQEEPATDTTNIPQSVPSPSGERPRTEQHGDDQEEDTTNIPQSAPSSPRERRSLRSLGNEKHEELSESFLVEEERDLVDLGTVDVEEQRQIMLAIWRSKQKFQSAGASGEKEKKKRGRRPVTNRPQGSQQKRPKEQLQQPGIGTYFQAREKP